MQVHLVPAPGSCHPQTVLLLDHEPESLCALPLALQDVCQQCLVCTTLEEALAAARRFPPALLICGQQLGVAAWEAIGVHASSQPLPVVFLSHCQLPDVIHRTLPLGSAYYIRRTSAAVVVPKLAGQLLAAPARRSRRTRVVMPASPLCPV
jgi:DNA-binding response OmpR family regulator